MSRSKKSCYDTGKKRVNITLDLSDFDDLKLVSEYHNIPFTVQACSFVVQSAREEAKKILKSGYIPKAQRGEDLFSQSRKTKRGKGR